MQKLISEKQTENGIYLLMMPGSKPFKTKDITKQLGCARLSFAEAEFMEEFLDITPAQFLFSVS